ncbi:transposase [Rhodothalassium salexigens DSM 2132]|nr:transposase [Rhodothalassium salexigens DSM 2132]
MHTAAPAAEKGEQSHAIGRSRGGRTTKIHALTDYHGRPLRLHRTGGNASDCRGGAPLLDALPAEVIVHADKGYDTDRVRQIIDNQGAAPNLPPKADRCWKTCCSPFLYCDRNAIERMVGRLKDFRRVATRYGRLAVNFLAAV